MVHGGPVFADGPRRRLTRGQRGNAPLIPLCIGPRANAAWNGPISPRHSADRREVEVRRTDDATEIDLGDLGES